MDVACERHGRGEPIALLHGVGTDRRVWHRIVPGLAESREVWTLDLPGFGESPPAGAGFELAAAADRVAAALRARASTPLNLLGHSLGGAIALVLADRHPTLVARLVLSAPAGLNPRPRTLGRAAGAAAEPLLAARRLTGMPLAEVSIVRRVLLAGAVHDGAAMSSADARLMLSASRGSRRLGAAVAAVASADLRAELCRLRAPLGALWGERDRVIPPGTITSLRSCAPAVELETIPLAGHVPQLERPAEFLAALRRLLDRLSPITDS